MKPETDLVLSLTKADYDSILLGKMDFMGAVADGHMALQGDSGKLAQFLGYFDNPGSSDISLTLH